MELSPNSWPLHLPLPTTTLSAFFFLLPTGSMLRPLIPNHLLHPLQLMTQCSQSTQTPSCHSLGLDGPKTVMQSTQRYREGEMEMIWTAPSPKEELQPASYQVGYQLISSPGYGYFEGPDRFHSEPCLGFSKSTLTEVAVLSCEHRLTFPYSVL